MKHVFFIRHGETDNNKFHRLQGRGVDASINETGREQANAIAEVLKDYPIERVIVSSLVRTLETATPLIEQSKALVEEYAELDEMSFGDFEGCYFNDVKVQIHEVNEQWMDGDVDVEIPGGESPSQVFERAGSKVIEILENAEEDHIVFLLHGRLIRILLSELLGKGLKNMHLIKHQNGSINHLLWNGSGFEAVELNKIDHLTALAINE
ncbi:MAG: histidine phosphatase family protein [Balneolaceae bacterium]|nr:histidine phosphatase family protein [Balneolaceae bacterium]MBO6546746.1 histidine phosphatase family protein [Balneolaceae bacterium]MBO6649104.1 histidine phosphatase family protein [Balneolaceae bacterium]